MSVPSVTASKARRVDLLRFPLLGPVLRWRHLRTVLQSAMLGIAVLVIYDGLTGSQIAPKNLAGVAPWIQWRGFTILSLLLAGSLFCASCPFMLTRRLAKRVLPGNRSWPRRLQGKWQAAFLLAWFFWFYQALAPWAQPWLTAALALAYFAGAFLVDGLFKGAAFCKYLCPIGQFNFVHSACSPLEIAVREQNVCVSCATKDCIRGRRVSEGRGRWQTGCEMWLFQQQKIGNLDCTFCLDCVHACPHDNVAIVSRVPGKELWAKSRRSSVGRLTDRMDLAALVLVLVFGGLVNAFGMVGPFYGFEQWFAGILHTGTSGLDIVVLYVFALAILPAMLVALTAWVTRAVAGVRESLTGLATRFSFSLVPVGFGMWAAHYGFHFMTGGLTLIPVTQEFLLEMGIPILGSPRWDLAALVPPNWMLPIELALLEAGLLGSLIVAFRIAATHYSDEMVARRAFVPWAILALALFAAGVWLMLQPMEMRGLLKKG